MKLTFKEFETLTPDRDEAADAATIVFAKSGKATTLALVCLPVEDSPFVRGHVVALRRKDDTTEIAPKPPVRDYAAIAPKGRDTPWKTLPRTLWEALVGSDATLGEPYVVAFVKGDSPVQETTPLPEMDAIAWKNCVDADGLRLSLPAIFRDFLDSESPDRPSNGENHGR